MLDFIKTASAVKMLYEYVKEEIVESDFFALLPKDYLRLPESDRQNTWYMLNPNKLNKKYSTQKFAFIVDEEEKNSILRAVRFVNNTSVDLPSNASFLEKLLYTKKFVPSCLYSSSEKAETGDAVVININTAQKNKEC